MKTPFYTIGHSNRTLPEFIDLLEGPGVKFVVDVRKFPRSRANPQFNDDALETDLLRAKIGYRHIAELGGRRNRITAQNISANTLWKNASFRNYADYAASDDFRRGLRELLSIGHTRPTAIMCAEAVWWRCHRRIIADYLLAAGENVFHILGRGEPKSAKLTPGTEKMDDVLIYPALRSDG